jgi:Protein of unknown function, DUF573
MEASSESEEESDSDSGSDHKTLAKTLSAPDKPTTEASSESEEESDSNAGSEPKSPAKTLTAPGKSPMEISSDSQEDSDSDSDVEEEENEAADHPDSPIKVSQPEPEKKKQKLSAADKSLPQKSGSAIQRIWTQGDELVLLKALAVYRAKHGKLPSTNEYQTLLVRIADSVSFPVTVKQIRNKIRMFRQSFGQKKKKGSHASLSNPHEMSVFKLSTELFEDGTMESKKNVNPKTNKRVGMKTDKAIGNAAAGGGAADGARVNGGAASKSCFYLGELMKDLIKREQLPEWVSTVEGMVAKIGESKAWELEAKIKELRIDSIKLHEREMNLVAELFGVVASGMVNDDF